MKKVVALLADGFEEVEALTTVDFLRRAGCEVIVAGVTGKTVTGGHDIVVEADLPVASCNDNYDAVVVPGGMPGASNIAESEEAIRLIRSVGESGGIVAAICAAPAVVLAPNGFLDGKRATCYPGYEDAFEATTFTKERVVVDGNTITSRGPGTAAEFAITVIEKLLGKETAAKIHAETLQK